MLSNTLLYSNCIKYMMPIIKFFFLNKETRKKNNKLEYRNNVKKVKTKIKIMLQIKNHPAFYFYSSTKFSYLLDQHYVSTTNSNLQKGQFCVLSFIMYINLSAIDLSLQIHDLTLHQLTEWIYYYLDLAPDLHVLYQ